MTWLYVKHLLLRTPLERSALKLRDISGIFKRMRHPELREIYLEEERIEQTIRRLIRPDSNCIDIGSHIGSFLSLLMRFAPRGKHVAFEPVPEKALWLKRKFPEVEVRNLALGDKHERLSFYQNASQPGFSGFAKSIASQDKVVELIVECEKLDNIVGADRRYDYVKIDVEGAELLVLKGASGMIARDTPIILFESSHDGAAKLGLKREDLFALFVDEFGYDVFLIDDFLKNRTALTLREFESAAVYPFKAFNFLAVPRDDCKRLQTKRLVQDLRT
jgi:FkbM family methyltransferase